MPTGAGAGAEAAGGAGAGAGAVAGAADGAGAGAGAEAADGAGAGELGVWSGGGVSAVWTGVSAAGVVAAPPGTAVGVGAFVVSCAWARAKKRPLTIREVTISRMG